MKMRSAFLLCAAAVVLPASVVSISLPAAVSADDVQAAAQKESTESKPRTRKKPAGRLPTYFGKIGIGDAQRERIYGIQAKYKEDIEKLEAQLAAIERKRDAEIHAILTDRQRAEYARLVAEAKKRREERKEKKETQEAP